MRCCGKEGEIGAGWTVAKALLGHERIMIAEETGAQKSSGGAIPADTELTSLAKKHLGEIAGRIGDQVVRDQVAAIEMDSCAISLTVQRTQDAVLAGQAMGPESSIFKAYGTELSQRRHELKMHILGPQSVGEGGPGFDADDLETTLAWLKSKAETIGGGTTEIQLNVIAKRVLGLPD